ncbi:MAG: glycosyltransferase family 2 protein [Lachnospiraceae bacterium]|nr:glycosyltransferase family 2 protein [Lachnospiraceae bacterium]
MKKLITFVVPCYNSQDYMRVCIESLLRGGDCVEILVINDGSHDDTHDIGKEYEEKYPGTVRLLDQENGGHGEGINHGLLEASGTYFKVVDSDDWLDEEGLPKVLRRLEQCEKRGGIDLMVCNYIYDHKYEPEKNQVINYKNVFPQNGIFGWSQTKPFLPWQYLTLHSCIFRTQMLRDCNLQLPKHVFFEDNLFVYTPLPYIKRICYMNVNLYHYFIGREGQSVSEEGLKKRYDHQLFIAEKIFNCHDTNKILKEEPKLGRYMRHEATFMLALASAFSRLNGSEEADKKRKEMWKAIQVHDKKFALGVLYGSYCLTMNLPGKIGAKFGVACYRLCHKFVAFN